MTQKEIMRTIDCAMHIPNNHARMLLSSSPIYRVELSDDGTVDVMQIDNEAIDCHAEMDGTFPNTTYLPLWMRERLAVLSVMKYNPPTTEVKGVGKRISRNIFWVIR